MSRIQKKNTSGTDVEIIITGEKKDDETNAEGGAGSRGWYYKGYLCVPLQSGGSRTPPSEDDTLCRPLYFC